MRASRVVRRAWACALVMMACTPSSTRPSFTPIPEALHAVINATPAVVTREASALLAADSLRVRRMSERDAWLETNEFAGTHRLRLWADPDVPGESRVTIEVVYRPSTIHPVPHEISSAPPSRGRLDSSAPPACSQA